MKSGISQLSSDIQANKAAIIFKLVRAVEGLAFTLLSWVPLFFGRILRRLTYRPLFNYIGAFSSIQPGVTFVGSAQISLGSEVYLDRGVRIRALNHHSSIELSNKVNVDVGVDIKACYRDIKIGEHTYIGPYTCISGGSIQIGRNCLIASHCSIYASNHIFTDPDVNIREQKSSFKGIVIHEDCWIGSGVRIVDGVTIGKGSIVGAGTVVTSDIPPYSVAVGVPARVVSKRGARDQEVALAEAQLPNGEISAATADNRSDQQNSIASTSDSESVCFTTPIDRLPIKRV